MPSPRICIVLLATLLPVVCNGQYDTALRAVSIDSVTVNGSRPLRTIGMQHTVLDSTVLNQRVSMSLAEVLSESSAIFIKSFGRATMATASLRGTAPSHTQVTWNGLKINSPTLGMVDFSTIPSFLVDRAEVVHGASSVESSSGGLGGAVLLDTHPYAAKGLKTKVVAGVGSYSSYDLFASVGWGGRWLKSSTRAIYSRSRNDFEFVNRDKLPENIYDSQGNVVGKQYPTERNRNGEYNDLNLLQDVSCRLPANMGTLSAAVWYADSHRGIPRMEVDYSDNNRARNYQNSNTVRTVAGWKKIGSNGFWELRAGYSGERLLYVSQIDLGGDRGVEDNIRSKNRTSTFFGQCRTQYAFGRRWFVGVNLVTNLNHVVSRNEQSMTNNSPNDMKRTEAEGIVTVRYRPTERVGVSAVMRGEIYDGRFAPLIPALLAEWSVVGSGQLVAKCSVARNYRHPSLNDLWFVPGGNPHLRPEKGLTADAGLLYTIDKELFKFNTEATLFVSRINDWILWLPTRNGYGHPENLRKAESRGVEMKANAQWQLLQRTSLRINSLLNYTRSVSLSDEGSTTAIGQQLPYVPRWSGSVTASANWRSWQLSYKWNWYSSRNTALTDNSHLSARLKPYIMNDLSLERGIAIGSCKTKLRADINNLFDEQYQTVLSRPMPPRNYSLALTVEF